MAGDDNHWRIIYGYRREAGGQQRRYVKLYDPRPNTVNEQYPWREPAFEIFISVGA
jgi:hypothetical protein